MSTNPPPAAEEPRLTSFGAWVVSLVPAWVTPNHLTFLRMGGALVMLALGLSRTDLWWVVVVGLITGFSDNLDGALARHRRQVTELGALLDPMADKLLALVLVVVLWSRGLVDWPPLLLAAITDAHALILPALVMARRRREGLPLLPLPKVRPNRWGKMKTAWLASSMGFVIMGAAGGWAWLTAFGALNIWVGVGLGLVAMVMYFVDWRAGVYV